MVKLFKLFKRDLRSIRTNIAATIIMLGLCILPSLYAWINIKACWDPYANTGNLPIAVVNNDDGAVFNGKILNVGDSVIEELNKNKSIGWVFVDEWQGNNGLNNGKYYALIEIPHNFSSGLISLSTLTPKKPNIVYRVNVKLNAIAAKISNAAKDKLVSNIKTSFVSTVNKEILSSLDSESTKLNIDKSDVNKMNSDFSSTNDNITKVKNYISDANTSSESLQKYLSSVQSTLPTITEQINSLQKVQEQNKTLISLTKETINSISKNINNDIIQIQSLNEQNKSLLSKLKAINNNNIDNDTVGIMTQLIDICGSLNVMLTSDINSIDSINKMYPSKALVFTKDTLATMNSLITIERDKLTKLKPIITVGSTKDSINTSIDELYKLGDQISTQTTALCNNYYSNSSQDLNNVVGNLTLKIDDSNSILESTRVILPQLNALAIFGTATSKLTVEQSSSLNDLLTKLQTELNTISDKTKDLSDGDINQIVKILEMNPSDIADFISSPVTVKQEEVYNTGVFGIGLTPFYTVLAIWVGSLLSAALLSVNCDDFDGEKLSLQQKHFGKMPLFLLLSLIQSLIIALGDVYLLGIHPANVKLMLLLAVLTGWTFTIIIFTLVSIFGNVGKAIAVIIMVFQIAGAGGIYPIQTNPKIFGMLHPLWPFTYAINAFREAIAGPIWKDVYHDIIALLIFMVIFLILTVLKKPFHRLTEFMEEKFESAHL